jgi:hypothetical protein
LEPAGSARLVLGADAAGVLLLVLLLLGSITGLLSAAAARVALL